MFVVTNERFEELAAEALDGLPASLSSQMDNVAVIVEEEAQGRNLSSGAAGDATALAARR